MSVIEFTNAAGQVRYQPQHPDGRRLFREEGWCLPYAEKRSKGSVDEREAPPWAKPMLYRSKRRAVRQLSKLIADENSYAHYRFKEVK